MDVPAISERLREPIRATLRGEAGSWPETLSAGEVRSLVNHGVAPLLYGAARIPELRGEAIRAAAVEPLRAEDLRNVLEALHARDVHALILKGGALAYQIYSTPDLRPRVDVDLLIDGSALSRVREGMGALGFSEEMSSGDEHGIRQTAFVRRDSYDYEHSYDVHWAVTNTPVFANALRVEDALARAVAIPQLGPHARGLSTIDALLLACIHRVAHHHDSNRLIWLLDIARLRDRMTSDDHRLFWELAARERVVAVCSRSIALADEWMSRPPHDLAEQWLSPEQLQQDEPSRAYLQEDITHGRVMLADLRALSWRERMQRLRQLAFPSPAFMEKSFGARHPLALPWLYLYRGARGVLRLFRRAGA